MNIIKSIFALIFITAATMTGVTSCAQDIKVNGNVITKARAITEFNQLTINGVFNVFINQGEKEIVKVETDENLQDIIITENKENILTIKWKDKASVKKSTKMNVYVTVKDIKEINIDGVGSVSTTSIIKTEDMKLKYSGVGNTSLEISSKKFFADISAVGNITLKGVVDEANIIASGTGNLKAFDLVVKKLTLNVIGIGNADVHAEEEISINSTGLGNVSYKGNATVKSMNTSGVGKVKKI